MKEHYINILQGKTGRWIQGESYISSGLYTDEITTCKIFILFGKKNGKNAISMTHYDGYTDLASIQSERKWFDQETPVSCYIFLREEAKNAYDGALFHIFVEDLKTKTINYEFYKNGKNHDAVIAYYDKQGASQIKGISTTDEVDLINHPNACDIYAYYKINIMHAELEGEFKHLIQFYKKQSIKTGEPELYSCPPNAQPEHISAVCTRLAGKVIHQQIIYDGERFVENLKQHDGSLTSFARNIIADLPKSIESANDLYEGLANAFRREESKIININCFHNLADWNNHPQILEIAKPLCHLKYKQHLLVSFPEYNKILNRYKKQNSTQASRTHNQTTTTTTTSPSPPITSSEVVNTHTTSTTTTTTSSFSSSNNKCYWLVTTMNKNLKITNEIANFLALEKKRPSDSNLFETKEKAINNLNTQAASKPANKGGISKAYVIEINLTKTECLDFINSNSLDNIKQSVTKNNIPSYKRDIEGKMIKDETNNIESTNVSTDSSYSSLALMS